MAEFNIYSRLEPNRYERNLEQGFAAAIYDPVWFLARQWQMGEHQGENASTPIWLEYTLSSRAIRAADPRFDPTVTPAEAIVESEVDDWWTMGRRVRLGRRLADNAPMPGDDKYRFYNPPPPYEHFHGRYDGLALWRDRVALGLDEALFGPVAPPDSLPAWSSRQLLYQQDEATSFRTDAEQLTVQRHRGGQLDWHSVDAAALPDAPAAEPPETRQVIPTPLDYPGAPNSRWWQIERGEVDPSSYLPDTAHTPTVMLTELIFSHSDDWFLFPVTARAGHVVTIETMKVSDAFGRAYDSETMAGDERRWPGLQPPADWSLFRTARLQPDVPGLSDEALVLWHVAEFPLESEPIERVQFGLDEQSNVLWAVERVVDAREVASRKVEPPDEALHPKFKTTRPPGAGPVAREFVYLPGQGAATYWHPYVLLEKEEAGLPRRLEQRRLVDFTRERPWPLPAPEAAVLRPDAGEAHHWLEPLAVPSNGIEVERRWQLARDMAGQPVLWIQRQRRPLLSPPGRRLRFDVMVEAVEEGA